MDPLTHALLGAVTATALVPARARSMGMAPGVGLAGAVGALVPDVDRLIARPADPLLHIEYHRHFTHALAFVPIGGLLAALPWLLSRRVPGHRRVHATAAIVGYATHGLLDASTTYGTLLLWPFSHRRVAWNWISIVDPLFTGILLAGVIAVVLGWRGVRWRYATSGPGSAAASTRLRSRAGVALAIALAYLAAGAWQRERALTVQQRIAAARGHQPDRAEVFPGFANNIVWRSLYEADGTLFMDRIRVPWAGERTWSEGFEVPRISATDLEAGVRADGRLMRDFHRFAWFSGNWVARAERDPAFLGDARYSLADAAFEPVWGIRFTPGTDPPIEWVDRSPTRRVDLRELLAEVLGRDPRHRSIP